MKVEIEIPDPPEGSTAPVYRALWLPIDPRAYVLRGDSWWKADTVISIGGSYWIVCLMPPNTDNAQQGIKVTGSRITNVPAHPRALASRGEAGCSEV